MMKVSILRHGVLVFHNSEGLEKNFDFEISVDGKSASIYLPIKYVWNSGRPISEVEWLATRDFVGQYFLNKRYAIEWVALSSW